MAYPPAPHPLLLSQAAHIQRQRPNTGQPGTLTATNIAAFQIFQVFPSDSDVVPTWINQTSLHPLAPQAYWRSCAALLGQVLEMAFKDDYSVELLTTPEVPGREREREILRFFLNMNYLG